jgi:transposase
MVKITKEQKIKIKEMYELGKSITEISKELELPYSTIQYHANEQTRKKHIEKAKNYSKENPRKPTEQRKEYMRNYMREYYKKKRENK